MASLALAPAAVALLCAAAPAQCQTWKNGPAFGPAYFPIAVWLQSPENAAKYKAAGMNLYVGLWQGPTDTQLAALKAAGMRVICDQNAVGLAHTNDPTIAAWMHGDEPDNAQPAKDANGNDTWGPCVPPARIVEDYKRIAAADPTRPVMLNLGQGVANDEWVGRGTGAKLSDYATFVQGADIVSYDVYPVAGMGKKNGADYLWYVAKGIDRLKGWTKGTKRIWMVLECTRIGNETGMATPEQVRSMAWMSIIHGASGLVYFVHQFKPTFSEAALLNDPAMLASVTRTNRQIQEMAPVINSPNVDGGVVVTADPASVPVSAVVKRHGGATYVLSVGMRNAPVTARFEVAGVRNAEVEVIGEGRTVRVTGGTFSDSFTPYQVHLYKIAK